MDLSQIDKNMFNEIKHVSVDFDGVLMANLFGRSWDFPSYNFHTSSLFLTKIKSLLQKSSALLDNIFRKPVPDSRSCILKFKEKGIKVSLLTSRGYSMSGLTKRWLKSHGLLDLFDNLYFTDINEQAVSHKKDMVELRDIDLHIDDRAHGIKDLSRDNPDKKFIYFNCHNVDIPSIPNVYTVKTWKEIEDLL